MSGDGVDVSLAQDGGCLKKILVEGEGDVPLSGMTAKVHYVGTLLDGTKFDSSRDRNEYFTFTLGKGQVIKGWDQGIATMKRGEKAILTCTPEYAYGAAGSPPKIPPNSTLQFEVEMFDFFGEDCTTNGDGGVRKTIITEGTGYACPREEATVEISYTARHLDRLIEERDVKFMMGDGSESGIVLGLELALYKMKKGEEARVTVKYPYGYGNSGNATLAVPGGADLEYTVTLKDLDQPKYSYELSKAEKLEYSAKAKDQGTMYFKKGNYERALKKYSLITEYLEEDGGENGSDEDENEEMEDEPKKTDDRDAEGFTEKSQLLLVAAHSNQALCYIKLSNGKDAIKSCDKVLKMDSKNVKALFRKGQGAELEQEYEEAIKSYQLLLEVEPNNTLAYRQIVICRNKIKTYREKEKKMYSNLFSRTNFKDPEPTKDDNKIKPDFSDSEEEEAAVENTEVNV